MPACGVVDAVVVAAAVAAFIAGAEFGRFGVPEILPGGPMWLLPMLIPSGPSAWQAARPSPPGGLIVTPSGSVTVAVRSSGVACPENASSCGIFRVPV